MFILITYLNRARKELVNRKQTVEQVQQRLAEVIDRLTKENPPGKKLTNESEDVKKALENVEMKGKKALKFNAPPEKLTSANRKQELNEIILKNAKIASEVQGDF